MVRSQLRWLTSPQTWGEKNGVERVCARSAAVRVLGSPSERKRDEEGPLTVDQVWVAAAQWTAAGKVTEDALKEIEKLMKTLPVPGARRSRKRKQEEKASSISATEKALKAAETVAASAAHMMDAQVAERKEERKSAAAEREATRQERKEEREALAKEYEEIGKERATRDAQMHGIMETMLKSLGSKTDAVKSLADASGTLTSKRR